MDIPCPVAQYSGILNFPSFCKLQENWWLARKKRVIPSVPLDWWEWSRRAAGPAASQPGSLSSFLSETCAVCCPAEYPAACPGEGLKGTRAPGIAAVRGNWRGRSQEIQAENGSYCGWTHVSVTECRSGNSSLNLSVAYRAICSLKLFTSVEILLMKLHFIGAL